MSKRKELFTKETTLKERVKFFLASFLLISVLTSALIFFANISGSVIIDVFAGADTVYYSWRDVFFVLFLPVIGYCDVFILLFLFYPWTYRIVKLWFNMINVITGYAILIFILTIPLSLYISFFPLGDYHSCGLNGPFSGVHYVKDRKMCEQFEYHPENDKSGATPTSLTPADTKIK